MPNFDTNFMVKIDASDVAVGAVLMQHDQPAAFILKEVNSAQCNYNTVDWELLAIVLACKTWCPYVDGKKIVVFTDHKLLLGIHTVPNLNKR